MIVNKHNDGLPNNPKINSLTEAWDDLGLSTDALVLPECILPDQSHVHVSPNRHRFIMRPTEDAAIYVKPSTSTGVEATTNVTEATTNVTCDNVTTTKPKR